MPKTAKIKELNDLFRNGQRPDLGTIITPPASGISSQPGRLRLTRTRQYYSTQRGEYLRERAAKKATAKH